MATKYGDIALLGVRGREGDLMALKCGNTAFQDVFSDRKLHFLASESEQVAMANKTASFCHVFAVPGASGPVKRPQNIYSSVFQGLNCADCLKATLSCFSCRDTNNGSARILRTGGAHT